MIITEALSWLGTPYHHQAATKGVGCDCLGLIRGVWQAVYGVSPEAVPAYTPNWAEMTGEETLYQAARRHCKLLRRKHPAKGHMILFRWQAHLPAKHCGIMISKTHFIHAYERTGVIEMRLSPTWKRRQAAIFSFPPYDPDKTDNPEQQLKSQQLKPQHIKSQHIKSRRVSQ